MEKVATFHEVVMNATDEDNTDELTRILATGKIECARGLSLDKIPLRDRFFAETRLENIGTEVGNETLHFGYIKSRELQQRTHIRSKDMLPALKLLEKHNWIKLCDNGKRCYIVILRNDSRNFPLI